MLGAERTACLGILDTWRVSEKEGTGRRVGGMPRELGHDLSGGGGYAGRRTDGGARDLGHVVSVEIGDAGLVPRDFGHVVSAGEGGA